MARRSEALATKSPPFLSDLQAIDASEIDAINRIFASWNAQASPHTVSARLSDLAAFGKHTWKVADPRLAAMHLLRSGPMVAQELALAWDKAAIAADLADTTRARRLTTLRSLVTHAAGFGLPWSLTGRVKSPRVIEYGRAQGPTPDVVENAIAELTEDERWSDLALVLLCFDLALRTSEACSLQIEDVDFGRRQIKVRRKGNRVVKRKMSRRCAAALHKVIGFDREGPVFPAKRHQNTAEHKHRSTAWALGHELGLGGLHGLRHTAGTLALERTGGNVSKVKNFLDHQRLNTTQVYMDRQNIERDAAEVTDMIAGED